MRKNMYRAQVNSPDTFTVGDISESATQIQVSDAGIFEGLPLPNQLTLGRGETAETVLLTAISGDTLTVERGFEYVPKPWPSGTVLSRNMTAYDLNAAEENIEELQTQAIISYTHAKTGTVHALTGPAGAKYLTFVATASFTDGDTFTVNGTAVTAKTIDGAGLYTGDFVSGQVVSVALEGSVLTFQFRSYHAALQTKANGNWSTYTSWGEIGCTGSESVQEIFEAIPVRSELIVLINPGANPVYPSTVGTLHIARVHTFRETALFSDTYGNRWIAETKSGESSVLFVKWVPLATAMPPVEHELTLAADKVSAGFSPPSFRKWQNGRVTLFVSLKRADDGNFASAEAAFSLPVSYRPIRHEVRHIALSNADGNPAGYAHLHIYPNGTATISGIGSGVKSAFCECGFWTSL